MTSLFAAQLSHSVHFYNTLLKINHTYLQGGESISTALSQLNINWENIRLGQEWAAGNFSQGQIATHLCRRFAGLEILDLRQPFEERIHWLESGLRASKKLNDVRGQADIWAKLGIAYAKQGNLKELLTITKSL